MVGEGSKVFRNDAGWPAFCCWYSVPSLCSQGRECRSSSNYWNMGKLHIVKSASLLEATESQDSDGGNEGGGPGATSVQLLGRTLMELRSILLFVKQQLCV